MPADQSTMALLQKRRKEKQYTLCVCLNNEKIKFRAHHFSLYWAWYLFNISFCSSPLISSPGILSSKVLQCWSFERKVFTYNIHIEQHIYYYNSLLLKKKIKCNQPNLPPASKFCRAVTKISSCWVQTTSRRGIKQLRISFGSIFLLFSYESSQRKSPAHAS